MSPGFADREAAFAELVASRFEASGRTLRNKAFGVSNSAKIVEGGIQLAVLNLERFDPAADGYMLFGVLRFVPADEVLFALCIRAGMAAMGERLATMRSLGSDDESEFAARNNNTVAYLAGNGSVFLRNKGFWDALPDDLSQAGTPIKVDALYTATWSRAGVPRGGAREFVDYLARIVGPRWTPLFPGQGQDDRRAPALDKAAQRSPVVCVWGPGAMEATIRHVLASHGLNDVRQDECLLVDAVDPTEAGIAAAVETANRNPGTQVWLVQRLAGDPGRRWIEGIHLAHRFGMELSVGGRPCALPHNLLVAGVWGNQPPPALPVPSLSLG